MSPKADNTVDDEKIVAETENLFVWQGRDEDDGLLYYHLEMGSISLHLSSEEWEELVLLVNSAKS